MTYPPPSSTHDTSLAALDQPKYTIDANVLHYVREEVESILSQHASFAAEVEDLDPEVCPKSDLINLIRYAPNREMRTMLYETYRLRQSISLNTGKAFL